MNAPKTAGQSRRNSRRHRLAESGIDRGYGRPELALIMRTGKEHDAPREPCICQCYAKGQLALRIAWRPVQNFHSPTGLVLLCDIGMLCSSVLLPVQRRFEEVDLQVGGRRSNFLPSVAESAPMRDGQLGQGQEHSQHRVERVCGQRTRIQLQSARQRRTNNSARCDRIKYCHVHRVDFQLEEGHCKSIQVGLNTHRLGLQGVQSERTERSRRQRSCTRKLCQRSEACGK